MSLANGLVALGESVLTFFLARSQMGPDAAASWNDSAGAAISLMFVAFAVVNMLLFLGIVYGRDFRPDKGRPTPPPHRDGAEEPHVRSNMGGPEPWSTPPPRTTRPLRPLVADPLEWAYRELSLPVEADATSVKRAYRRLALEFHPDRNDSATAAARFRIIKAAYDALVEDREPEPMPYSSPAESVSRGRER